DPSIAARFNNGDYFKAIDDLAARLVAAGVKRVEGDIVGDESYFVGPKYGAGWNWEDLTWYYGAEIPPLTVNDNARDLFIKPGAAACNRALAQLGHLILWFRSPTKSLQLRKARGAIYRFIVVWGKTQSLL